MKKINLKRLFAVIALPCALMAITTSSFAFGEHGCVTSQGANIGVCRMNTEGGYGCYYSPGSELNCVSAY